MVQLPISVTVDTLRMVHSSPAQSTHQDTFLVTSYISTADITNLKTANITIDIASAYNTAGIDFNSGNIICSLKMHYHQLQHVIINSVFSSKICVYVIIFVSPFLVPCQFG